jgi:gluconate:H+ symporter, GntP family
MHPSDAVRLPLLAALAVLAIVILIARVRLHAFLAITVVSLALAICAGMTPSTAVRAFQDGVGSTLGFIAIVIGLGSIFGKLLAESGAAQVVASTVVAAVGTRALPWAVAALGFVLGLPVFFSVGLVLLFPIVVGLAASSGRPLLTLALPLVAGLSASHGLVPPHPGPLAAIERVGADTGRTILFAMLCAIPAAILGGPVAIRLLHPRASQPLPVPDTTAAGPVRRPGFLTSVVTLLLPVLLMLSATIGDFAVAPDSVARRWIDFTGSPSVAMLIATLVALRVFGTSCGFPLATIVRFVEDSLGPIASVLLIVGAGGGFGRVLEQAGVGQAIATAASGLHVSTLVAAWILAALLRVAVGSATVAITTSASLMAPVAAADPGTNRELLVVALGAGSIVASHVNDGGFWLVKEYLGLDVGQTLRSWTVIETILSVTALIAAVMLNALLTPSP